MPILFGTLLAVQLDLEEEGLGLQYLLYRLVPSDGKQLQKHQVRHRLCRRGKFALHDV